MKKPQVDFHLPAPVIVVLGLLGGVLQYLNQATFTLSLTWHQVITFGLFVVAVMGASPLVGQQFRKQFDNLLHISPAAATIVTVVMTVLAAGLTTFSLSKPLLGVLEGILSFAAFVGFGPAAVSALTAPKAD